MAAVDNWRTRLNNQQFCKQLREGNAKDSRNKLKNSSRGLLAIYDGDLFVWNGYASNVIHYNLKYLLPTSADKKDRYQVLICTSPPRFEVEHLLFNRTGSVLAIWGHGGIMVMELPQRWGRYAELAGGNDRVECKSSSIADHYFASHMGVVLLQVLWHPGSDGDTHVAFLTSDNLLRVHDIQDPNTPVQVIRLGETVQEFNQSPSRIAVHAALGDSAVSFDFGAPIEIQQKRKLHSTMVQSEPDRVWPAYVVRGNGDIVIAYTNVKKSLRASKLPVQGPLLMYPPAEDNYGVDACTIAVLGTDPQVLVIVTCEGKLHHCVLLPTGVRDNSSLQVDSFSFTEEKSSMYENPDEVSLYVYESIELELSLTTNRIETDERIEDDFTCPIKVVKDPTCLDRYHCTHSAGIHTVVLPWIRHYQEFFKEDQFEDSQLPEYQECVVEHLICTKPLPSSPASPILGLGIVKDLMFDPCLLTLTSDYEFITMPLSNSYKSSKLSLASSSASTHIQSPLRRTHKEPFDCFIQRLLQRGVTNPLLKSGKGTEMSQQECFQLLSRTTQVFREEYLQKQDLVHQEIQKRVRILRDLKDQQEVDLQRLLESRNIVRDRAHDLANKYDDCQCKHEEILRRTQSVMRKLQQRSPVLSEAEINMKRELEAMEDQLDMYRTNVEQLKIKQDYQRRQTQHLHNQSVSSPTLPLNQRQQIKEFLRQEGDDLADMFKRLNSLKIEAGV